MLKVRGRWLMAPDKSHAFHRIIAGFTLPSFDQ
jgi:hypothetical protein